MLDGATVIVAGAGHGLGREVAAVCRREGTSVMLAARSAGTLSEVATAVDPDELQSAVRATDVRDPAQCVALVEACVARFGRVDAVVTSARGGIRVNTVAPGWMWGPSLEHSLGAIAGDAAGTIAKIGKRLPLGTVAEDGDVAEAVAFLASPRAKAITGRCLLVNAGEYPG